MPSIPLVSELGNNAGKFQSLVDSTPTPTSVKGTSKFTTEDNEALFTDADTRIFVRVRPVLQHELSSNNRVPVVRRIAGVQDSIFMAPKISLSGSCSLETTPVKVHRTFGSEDSTDSVYATAGKQLLDLAVNGASSTVICYGQTGSGKTFTATGLLERMAKDFAAASEYGGVDISVIAIEIKAEKCVDLITGEEVNICEDTKSEVQTLGATEVPVRTEDEVARVCAIAIAARSTKATERNAGSSRSHMVIRFVLRQREAKWARPGLMVFADLAGSESTSDSANHDKERVNETKFINSSLMTLKDCIRSRASAGTSSKHVHIPYRQSKLTLLLRDSFELAVKRPTKTVVIATVSPLLADARHTSGTLRYASLLVVQPPARVLQEDPEDPSSWSRPKALEFLANSSRLCKNPEGILTEGDGRAMTQIPEAEFIRRAVENCAIPEKSAKMLYNAVWKKVVDARTKQRKQVLKVNQDANRFSDKNVAARQQMMNRIVAGH